MANEYNGDKIVLRDTEGNQMSLPLFFKLATRNSDGSHVAQPSSGVYRNGSTEFHGGWDMGCNGATDIIIRTPTAGTAVYVGGCGGFGPNLVIIKEDTQNRYHYFGHMASASVQQGDTVEQGDEVGIAGGYGGNASSGWNPSAYPIHLHYEIMNKNLMVDGGYSTDKQNVIDPMTAFDEATLPSGWQYGYDPDHPSNDYAAINYSWDYIPLDTGGIDFGPPGGDVPSEPFFTDSPCYDISHPQGGNAINPIIQSNAGGVIIGVGRFGWRDSQGQQGSDGYTEQSSWAADIAAAKGNIPFGLYFYSYVKASEYEQYGFDQGLTSFQNAGIEPKDVSMGIWIDIEDADSVTSDKTRNFALVQKFCKVFTDAGYPLVGLYSAASPLRNWYNQSDLAEFPLWAAAIGNGNISFENATRDNPNLTSNLPENEYKNVYIYQYSWVQHVPGYGNDLDGDRVLLPMPVVGSGGGGGGGGGGGSYTLEILVDVIPPKRIYFNPNPGLLTIDANLQNREQSIEILTDAEDATIYYTLDGSAPYEYVTSDLGNITYALSTSATAYSGPIKIYSDTHIRAIALSASGGLAVFDDILAKGSGTFIYSYRVVAPEWSVEREAYALEDSASHEALYEENKQAFILEHTKETIEDVVYATVHLSANTGGESEASEETPEIEPADSGQTPATPEPEPEDT